MENYTKQNDTIKSWAEEDRPREKLQSIGARHLTNAELLAILLGSGSKTQTAVGLAQSILNFADNDLNQLGRCSLESLMEFKGVGEAKAITIAAALELGRRRQTTEIQIKPKIGCSKDAYDLIAPILMDLTHEEFWILFLNRANQVFGKESISSGGITGTVVDARMIFNRVIEKKAVSIVLVHNHPSGNVNPSFQDIDLTKKLVEAGKLLDVTVVDHLIIAGKGYYSFADSGRI